MTAAKRRGAKSPGRRLLDDAWRVSAPLTGTGHVPLAAMAGQQSGSFYDGSAPDRTLVTCPDCREPADALFGDHLGACVGYVRFPVPSSALGILRALAWDHAELTVEQVAAAFRNAGVRSHSARAALASAEQRGWLLRSTTGLRSRIAGQRVREEIR